MTVAGQTQIVYTFDNANRLTNIQQGTSNIIIGYDDADRRTSVTYPNPSLNTNSITYGYKNKNEGQILFGACLGDEVGGEAASPPFIK